MKTHFFPVIACCALLVCGCADAPLALKTLPWQDARGDRGAGVRDRDLVQCADAVEQRRSAMAGCMERKGWRLGD